MNTIGVWLLFSFLTVLHPFLSSTFQASRASGGKSSGKASVAKPQRDDPDRPRHFENAQRLLNEGKFQEAVQEYRLSLENNPDNEAAHFGMAFALTHLGKTGEAIESYQAALQINPKLWEAELNWGMILFNQQDLEGAITHFQKAQKLDPENFQAFFLEGKAQELAGNPTTALNSLLQALPLAKEEQNRIDIHAALGSIYIKQRDWKEAEKHLTIARAGGKKDIPLDLDLAQVYFETEQFEKCASLIKPLADANPQEVEVQAMMARILARKGDAPGAIYYYQLAIKQETDKDRRQNLSLDLIAVYEKSGETAKTMTLLRDAAASSTDSKLHFHLGTLCLQQRDYDCALRSFLMALKLKPDCPECYSNLGSVFMLAEKYPEAIVALSKFRDARPNISGTYFYLGLAYDKLEDIPNAMSNYQKFLELDQGKSDKQDFQARERLKVLKKTRKKR